MSRRIWLAILASALLGACDDESKLVTSKAIDPAEPSGTTLSSGADSAKPRDPLQSASTEQASTSISVRGLAIGMSAESIMTDGLADGAFRSFPPTAQDDGTVVMKLFNVSTPDCAVEFNRRVASWSKELASQDISCDHVGQLVVDKESKIESAYLFLNYFEADANTTDLQFLQGLADAYGIASLDYAGRTDDSMMLGKGAVIDTWMGVAGSGETFRVTKRGWPFGLTVAIERVSAPKF